MVKGKPCKVSSVSTSKTGKHGHAKCNFTAVDIFTGKKCEEIIPSTHTAMVPVVTRKEYTLMDIGDDDFMTLYFTGDVKGDEDPMRSDIKLPAIPEGFAHEIREKFENAGDKEYVVTLLSAIGTEQIVAIKEVQEAK